MNKQKYIIEIVPHFGISQHVLKEASFIIASVEYDVYCNGEFVRRYSTEDSLLNGLSLIKDVAPRSQELVVNVNNKFINQSKF